MKKIISFLIFFGIVAAHAQTNDKIEFTTTKYSFGKIKQHVPASTSFEFTNKSDGKLIVESATAECGCTTPEFPKTPIAKGKTETIKVTYNAENPGQFTKKVTVKFANVAEPVILTIEGEVEVSKE